MKFKALPCGRVGRDRTQRLLWLVWVRFRMCHPVVRLMQLTCSTLLPDSPAAGSILNACRSVRERNCSRDSLLRRGTGVRSRICCTWTSSRTLRGMPILSAINPLSRFCVNERNDFMSHGLLLLFFRLASTVYYMYSNILSMCWWNNRIRIL